MGMKKKLDFLYFDAGGGHRSAANALMQVITDQQRPWEVRMVNLQEVLDPLDVFRKLTGRRMQDLYNLLLKKGWTLGSPQLTFGMHLVLALYRPAQVRLLEKFWRQSRPDMVVSLVPNFNLALGREPAQGDARRAVGDHPHRYRRLPAAFLDRAAGTAPHLRIRPARWSRRARTATRSIAFSARPG